jgi:hypothetical protein
MRTAIDTLIPLIVMMMMIMRNENYYWLASEIIVIDVRIESEN